MKITVDIDDLYVEDGTITEELKRTIVHEAVTKIKSGIRDECKRAIENAVAEEVERHIQHEIAHAVTAMSKDSLIRNRRKSNGAYPDQENLTLEEYVRQEIVALSQDSMMRGKIEQIANRFTTELKKRYDLAFASSIVSSMANAGLLKDERLLELLETNNK